MKVAIYCKSSAQDERPERQRADLEEYAKRMGYEYEVFEEKESGRGTRPIKQGLLTVSYTHLTLPTNREV